MEYTHVHVRRTRQVLVTEQQKQLDEELFET
jgi:hypothetical protein